MNDKKRELLTIDLETWNEMIRENERQSIKISTLEHALEEYQDNLKDMFEEIMGFVTEEDEADEVDEEATLKMLEEEKSNE